MFYTFFWVIPRRLKFICRRFGTLSVPSRCEEWTTFEKCWGIIREKDWLKPSLFPYNTPTFLKPSSFFTPTCLWRWNSVPKRRHIKFRRRGITQKKACDSLSSVNIYFTYLIFLKMSCNWWCGLPTRDLIVRHSLRRFLPLMEFPWLSSAPPSKWHHH